MRVKLESDDVVPYHMQDNTVRAMGQRLPDLCNPYKRCPFTCVIVAAIRGYSGMWSRNCIYL